MKLITVGPEAFDARYGPVDTSRAICSFTKPADTHVVITLLVHYRPRRIVEIGTALGHMTANLTYWARDDAHVYTIGMVAGMADRHGPQAGETPARHQFAAWADHFGTASRAFFVTADSTKYDFARLAPIDLTFIDGAHDLAHVRADTANVYRATAPGGVIAWHDFDSPVPWVEVRTAIERAGLPEPVYHVVGTEVAFLVKRGPAAPESRPVGRLSNRWLVSSNPG